MSPRHLLSLEYSAPGDRYGQIAVDLAKTLGILIGVGGLALLGRQAPWFWLAGVAGGLVAMGAGALYMVRQARRKLSPWWWLPLLAIAIGGLITLAALLAYCLEKEAVEFARWLEMYFVSPALLLWVAGEGCYFYPHFNTRPRHIPQVTGMLKGLLQSVSAIAIWTYLGLSIGLAAGAWLPWLAVIFALAGAYLGVLSEMATSGPAPAGP